MYKYNIYIYEETERQRQREREMVLLGIVQGALTMAPIMGPWTQLTDAPWSPRSILHIGPKLP